jgi:hypothetical protein
VSVSSYITVAALLERELLLQWSGHKVPELASHPLESEIVVGVHEHPEVVQF